MPAYTYPSFSLEILEGRFNWLKDVVKCFMVDRREYYYARENKFVSDIPADCILTETKELEGKAIYGGNAYADNVKFYKYSVPFITPAALIVYKDTGNASSSPLYIYCDDDRFSLDGMYINPDKEKLVIEWSKKGVFGLGADKKDFFKTWDEIKFHIDRENNARAKKEERGIG